MKLTKKNKLFFIKSLNKTVVLIRVSGLLFLILLSLNVYVQEKIAEEYKESLSKISLFFEVKIDLTYVSSLLKKIENIPLEIRDVPMHSDDLVDPNNVAPIEPDDVDFYPRLSFMSFQGGVKFPISERLRIKAGLKLEWVFRLCGVEFYEREDMRERNYMGSDIGTNKRGSGHALTYYSANEYYLFTWNKSLKPGLFVEVDVDLARNITFSAGYLFNIVGLSFENGWDRYNSLERWKTFNYGTIKIHNIYGQIQTNFGRIIYIGLHGGLSLRGNFKPEELGQSLDLTQNKTGWFCGMFLGVFLK